MATLTTNELRERHCQPCEGGVEPCPTEEAREQLEALPEWSLSEDGRRITRSCELADFAAGMDLLNQVARLAEDEGHHPDLHLEGYRHVRVELTTHAIGGLSENDFVLAAKIHALSVG